MAQIDHFFPSPCDDQSMPRETLRLVYTQLRGRLQQVRAGAYTAIHCLLVNADTRAHMLDYLQAFIERNWKKKQMQVCFVLRSSI
jgi:hypothetical protein